jgi:hypothetical protein
MNLVREYKPPRVRSILRKMKMYAEQQGNLLKYRIKSRYDNNPLVHVGSLEYVRGFACGYGTEGGDRIVIVKVNPADVVSVPYDCQNQKVRTCKYEVLREYTGPLPEYEGSSCEALEDLGDPDDDEYAGIHVTVRPGTTVHVHAVAEKPVEPEDPGFAVDVNNGDDIVHFQTRNDAMQFALAMEKDGNSVEVVDNRCEDVIYQS